ncbi:MAG: hypothetical protein Q4D76_18485, partial [Oscillospiraceae bacterium]|nr:hypothetical protein [Oscillospiraceae bacterium]
MEKIYSKIVRERKEEFQIETSIQQDCKKKYVVKRPLCPAGVTHIRRMEETYIKEKKNNTLLCPCFIEGDSVYFEYVNGITLCQKMLRSVETGNEIELQRLIKEYEILIEKLCCGKEKTNVQFEGEFSEVFGNLGNEEQRRISENSYSDLV